MDSVWFNISLCMIKLISLQDMALWSPNHWIYAPTSGYPEVSALAIALNYGKVGTDFNHIFQD